MIKNRKNNISKRIVYYYQQPRKDMVNLCKIIKTEIISGEYYIYVIRIINQEKTTN